MGRIIELRLFGHHLIRLDVGLDFQFIKFQFIEFFLQFRKFQFQLIKLLFQLEQFFVFKFQLLQLE